MKNPTFITLIFLIFTQASQAQRNCSDCDCKGWKKAGSMGRQAQISINICERASGGSGYVGFKNNADRAVQISYEIHFNNGESQSGSIPIGANSETSGSSCFNCAEKNGGGVSSWSVYNIKFEGEASSNSDNSSSNNKQSSSTSGWDENETLLDDEVNEDGSYTEESNHQKKQHEARQAEERKLAHKRAEEKRIKDAIARQNQDVAQKEKAIKESVGKATNTIGNAVESAMEEGRKRQEEEWRKKDQAKETREKMEQEKREQAYDEWGRFHCKLNKYLTGNDYTSNEFYCSVYRPNQKLSLQNAVEKAKTQNTEFIYFSYMIIGVAKKNNANYIVNFDYTEPHEFPHEQLQYLEGNKDEKLNTLYDRALKESFWNDKMGSWGSGNLGKRVVLMLFSDTEQDINDAIDDITGMIYLPKDVEPSNLLNGWKYTNFERGANLVELAKNNEIGTENNYIYKTENNEVVYLNKGKFILIKNGELLDEYMDLDGVKSPYQLQPSIENNKLTIHSWQKTILRQYATYKNMYLKIESKIHPGWTNYSLSPSEDIYKVPLAFWDWGSWNDGDNNAVYVLNKRKVKDLFFNNPSSKYRFLDIDGDAFIPTGMFRPAVAYGTYQVESQNGKSKIRFNYQGAFNWSAAVHIKSLKEADKIKGIVKLIMPKKNIYKRYRIYDSYEPYDVGGWKEHPKKDNLIFYDTDHIKFQKYIVTDWEIVYQYKNLWVKKDGDVKRWLAIKRKLGYGENYFPQCLSSEETYKIFTQIDQVVEAEYNPNKKYITINSENGFNELFDQVKYITEEIDSETGESYFNTNLIKNPKGEPKAKKEVLSIRENNQESKSKTESKNVLEEKTEKQDDKSNNLTANQKSDYERMQEVLNTLNGVYKDNWNTLNQNGYKIDYPKDWNHNNSGAQNSEFILTSPEVGDIKQNAAIRMESGNITNDITLASYQEIYINGYLKKNFNAVNILKNETQKLNNYSYQNIQCSLKTNDHKNLMFSTRIIIHNNKLYMLLFVSKSEEFNRHKPTVEKIFNSFTIL